MPRVTIQKKSNRGKEIKCGKCGEQITVGQEYKKWSKRFGFGRISGMTYYRCLKPACAPRESELMSGRSAEMAAVCESFYDAIDSFRDDDSSDVSGFYSNIDDVISEAENLRDEMQDGFDNMPEGLQGGDTGQLIEQRVEALDEFISELESAKDQADESALEESEIRDSLNLENLSLEKINAAIEEKSQEVKDEIIGNFESINLEIP